MPNPAPPQSPLPPPLFLASHPALDFLNSYATPDGAPVEWLADGIAFARWYREAGIAKAGEVDERLARLGADELDSAAAEARGLREEIRTGLRSPSTARTNAHLRDLLNRWMARGSEFQRLEGEGGELRLVVEDRCEVAEQMLVPLAAAAANLLVKEDLTRVRICEGPVCSLWFLDRTKAGTRRFCSAATCGNRAKVAAFRERKRASQNE
jgi:predicted RNA-binding Zn ribbon-like protein